MGESNNQDAEPSSKSVDLPKKRLYQVWKGRNKFLCGGRLIFGPDGGSLFLSIFLIGAPALTFCIKMFMRIPHVEFLNGLIVLIVGIILTILDLFFLFLTSTRNPGIVPRNSREMEPDNVTTSTISMEWINGAELKLPRTQDVSINGHTVKVKYCDTCLLYRPLRASHCSICNNCVQRFDHHCPWIGQCIGIRNYRTFFMFILTSTILCIYVFTFSLMNLIREPGSIWSSMSRDFLSVILIFYCFISVWFVGGLTLFHCYLMCTSQTTYENFRYRYDKKKNPYNQGVIKNLKEIIFSKSEPSLVNFREWVTEEDDTEVDSMSRKFCGELMKSNKNIIDFEVGILGKDGKPLLEILQNLNYNGIEDSLRKDDGGKIGVDPFLFPNENYEMGDSVDDDSTEIGRPAFDEFLKKYIATLKFQSIDTDMFLDFLKANIPGIEDHVDLKLWTEGTGIPPDAMEPASEIYSKILSLAREFMMGRMPNEDEVADWGGQEWELYLENIPKSVGASQVSALNARYRLSESKDYEVKVAFLQLVVSSKCSNYYTEVEKTLKEVGRMKYLRPFYTTLVKGTEKEEKVFAKRIFSEACAS